ncbi:MATE family efflux transporter [Paenibacillus sp. UNC451MF]|uniref:MATE family efflux transporter n=1 Tax=Paenibacillus sp. UNC451MF TaxID=1449063 RepID=UPI000A66D737|nr:MATE family efflux transporter [Paenibacillus sp. UNC451MF]
MLRQQKKQMTLWMLAWPIFLEMLLQFLLGTVDTLMVSHISDGAVAVIGISNQLFAAVNILFTALASGTGILVAQKLGANQAGTARSLGIVGTNICVGVGIGLSVLLHFGAGPITRMLQLPESLRPMGETYISIVGGGMVLLAAMTVLSAVIRNTGNTRSPMIIAIGMNVIHVIMNYIVIYGAFGLPVLGLQGVAFSTTISRLIGVIMLLVVFRHTFAKSIGWKDFRLMDRTLMKETFRLSWPLGVNSSSWCFTQLIIFSIIATLGAKELSARTYMNTMESFCFMIGFSVALAGQIRIANLHGAGEHSLAYKCAFRTLWIGLAFVQANAFLLYGFGQEAIQLFTSDQEIIAFGVSLLGLNLLLQPSKMLNMAVGNALTAIGDTRFIMICGTASLWIIAAGMSYYMGIKLGWGLTGIYIAMIADELVRGMLVLYRWRSLFKHRIRAVSKGAAL